MLSQKILTTYLNITSILNFDILSEFQTKNTITDFLYNNL